MSLRTVAILTVFSAAPFGLGFLLMPELVSSIFGVAGYNEGTLIGVRKYGVGLLFAAAGAYAIASSSETDVIARFGRCYSVVSALGTVVSSHAAATAAANILMWPIAVLFGVLAVLWWRVASGSARRSRMRIA